MDEINFFHKPSAQRLLQIARQTGGAAMQTGGQRRPLAAFTVGKVTEEITARSGSTPGTGKAVFQDSGASTLARWENQSGEQYPEETVYNIGTGTAAVDEFVNVYQDGLGGQWLVVLGAPVSYCNLIAVDDIASYSDDFSTADAGWTITGSLSGITGGQLVLNSSGGREHAERTHRFDLSTHEKIELEADFDFSVTGSHRVGGFWWGYGDTSTSPVMLGNVFGWRVWGSGTTAWYLQGPSSTVSDTTAPLPDAVRTMRMVATITSYSGDLNTSGGTVDIIYDLELFIDAETTPRLSITGNTRTGILSEDLCDATYQVWANGNVFVGGSGSTFMQIDNFDFTLE